MKVFYGTCPDEQCYFIFAVADRLPNCCPECGKRLFTTNEKVEIAKTMFVEYTAISKHNNLKRIYWIGGNSWLTLVPKIS